MDPILSELSRTMIDKVAPSSGPAPSEGGGFKAVLDQTLQSGNVSTDKMLEMVDSGFGNKTQLSGNSAESIRVEFAQNAKEVGDVNPKKEQFFDFLGDFNREQNKMEELLSMASSKKSMNPQELCAVQAAMQKASMGSEVLVRGTELAVRSVQSTINLQVG
ncbi:MAG: hypothetical protein HQM15_10160 [Deltaproteobacteria bacterium]|nr:hypothetical protein [Deltaproteobacteria bacterium]